MRKQKHKQQAHCGVCQDFPCQLLDRFSYDQEQGDAGIELNNADNGSINGKLEIDDSNGIIS